MTYYIKLMQIIQDVYFWIGRFVQHARRPDVVTARRWRVEQTDVKQVDGDAAAAKSSRESKFQTVAEGEEEVGVTGRVNT